MSGLSSLLTILKRELPPGVVISTDDETAYRDPYPLKTRIAQPGVRPRTVGEVRTVVREAQRLGVPLWTVSRGKNNGYGGAQARTDDCLILDLSDMNRIIEVNEELAYAIVEPGVTFFDLYNYIAENDLKVWPSTPALGWGSLIGNTLERGWGYTPAGDHAQQQCGMEVVLPDGDVLRTGMGAMEGSPVWPLFKGGYGPGLDQLFFQSNLGIVTKMGIWLYPMPSGFTALSLDVLNEDELPELIDRLAVLRRAEILQNNPLIGNDIRMLSAMGNRQDFYSGTGAIPDNRRRELRSELKLPAWNARMALYGDRQLRMRRLEMVHEAFDDLPGFTLDATHVEPEDGRHLRAAEVPEHLRMGQVGYPNLLALSSVNWAGKHGGHIGFAPIMPPDGARVYDLYQKNRKISQRHGFDFYAGFHLYPRHLAHINVILFDQDDDAMKAHAHLLFQDLVTEARERGYSEYRAHLDYMDLIADQYDFNDHALRRTQERLKDALDPAGILSPGKQGVWPAARRSSNTNNQSLSTADATPARARID